MLSQRKSPKESPWSTPTQCSPRSISATRSGTRTPPTPSSILTTPIHPCRQGQLRTMLHSEITATLSRVPTSLSRSRQVLARRGSSLHTSHHRDRARPVREATSVRWRRMGQGQESSRWLSHTRSRGTSRSSLALRWSRHSPAHMKTLWRSGFLTSNSRQFTFNSIISSETVVPGRSTTSLTITSPCLTSSKRWPRRLATFTASWWWAKATPSSRQPTVRQAVTPRMKRRREVRNTMACSVPVLPLRTERRRRRNARCTSRLLRAGSNCCRRASTLRWVGVSTQLISGTPVRRRVLLTLPQVVGPKSTARPSSARNTKITKAEIQNPRKARFVRDRTKARTL